MPSKKYTIDDVKKDEILWKEMVGQNEILLLRQYLASKDYSKPYFLAEKNAWIIRTLRDKKQRYKLTT